jgi:hypothetical protein
MLQVSPDGKHIAYIACLGTGPYGLYIRSVATGETRMITDEISMIHRWDWSQDSDYILCHAVMPHI